ncbi:hypothetical protein BGZ49_004862 [Haplosporangium sp. Z 27]|nr:hypothetical protein BGZ49_004862 [Haplosporangium sp. Z 27]
MEKAFKIPEIHSQISQTLSRNEIIKCMVVCSQWEQDFRPYLWYEMSLTQRLSYRMIKEYFQKYAHLIRELTICDPVPILNNWLLPPVCCNLVKLKIDPKLSQKRMILSALLRDGKTSSKLNIDQNIDFFSLESVDKVIDLINHNSNLQKLEDMWFQLSNPHIHTQLFLELLCSQGSNVAQLFTSYWKLSSLDTLKSLLDKSPRLRSLTFFQTTIDLTKVAYLDSEEHNQNLNLTSNDHYQDQHQDITPSVSPNDQQTITLNFDRLHNLTMMVFKFIDSQESAQSRLVIHAPQLVSLSYTGFQGSTLIAQTTSHQYSLARRISAWNCPNIKELMLTQDDLDAIRTMKLLLTSIDAGLKRLEIRTSVIDSATINKLLQNHAMTLEHIDLSETIGVISSDLQLILTSCPNLIHFYGSGEQLLASDMIKKPWVCKKLERLFVFLNIPETNSTLDPDNDNVHNLQQPQPSFTKEGLELYNAIYDQLAPLTQLKLIRFRGYSRATVINTGIPWSLKCGLDRLRGLSKMESIYLSEIPLEIGWEEIEWFEKYWPNLKTIHLLDFRDVDPQVADALRRYV